MQRSNNPGRTAQPHSTRSSPVAPGKPSPTPPSSPPQVRPGLRLTPTEERIVAELRRGGPRSRRVLAAALEMQRPALRQHAERLRLKGVTVENWNCGELIVALRES